MTDERFAFASEIKALLQFRGSKRSSTRNRCTNI